MSLQIAVCGLDCGACSHLGSTCSGCASHSGKVFWAQPSGLDACPIFSCARGKGHDNCGLCAGVPCGLWTSTREDGFTDEDFNAQLERRIQNLKALT